MMPKSKRSIQAIAVVVLLLLSGCADPGQEDPAPPPPPAEPEIVTECLLELNEIVGLSPSQPGSLGEGTITQTCSPQAPTSQTVTGCIQFAPFTNLDSPPPLEPNAGPLSDYSNLGCTTDESTTAMASVTPTFPAREGVYWYRYWAESSAVLDLTTVIGPVSNGWFVYTCTAEPALTCAEGAILIDEEEIEFIPDTEIIDGPFVPETGTDPEMPTDLDDEVGGIVDFPEDELGGPSLDDPMLDDGLDPIEEGPCSPTASFCEDISIT